MQNMSLNTELIQLKMAELGKNQKALANDLGLSEAAISYWLKGEKLPDYQNMRALSINLNLDIASMLIKPVEYIHRFRKNKNAKPSDRDNLITEDMSAALRDLLPLIEKRNIFINEPFKLRKPCISYNYLQDAASLIRDKMCDDISVESIIRFIASELNTIVIPTLWGESKSFCNALQITDLINKISFLYLNLNSKNADLKFMLLHEAAHIMAPEIEGEEFADALAETILFPKSQAALVYSSLNNLDSDKEKMDYILEMEKKEKLSFYTIYKAVRRYAEEEKLVDVLPEQTQLFKRKSRVKDDFYVNESDIEPEVYLSIAKEKFNSLFFEILKEYINLNDDVNAHYIRRALNISYEDALSIYTTLKS
jgi:transcriptional regulator with XRE-family HTH domain